MTRIVVCDLDSTIADTSPRHHLSPFADSTQTWHSYSKACVLDKPIKGTITLLRMFQESGRLINILTGRRSSARAETIDWLEIHKVPWDVLRMREEADEAWSNIEYKVNYIKDLTCGIPEIFISDYFPECTAVEQQLRIPSLCVNPGFKDPTVSQWYDNGKGANE